MTETKKRSTLLELIIVFLLLLGIVFFSSSIVRLGSSRMAKMALSVAVYIGIAGIPMLAMFLRKIPFSTLHFRKKNIGKQLIIAIILFAITISAAVVIPLLVGVSKSNVFGFKSASIQVLVFYLVFDFICVGFGEEIAFRGYIYSRIESLSSITWLPMVLSALAFGLWHYPNTHSLINVVSTGLIGLLYGFCRWKIKGCSLLSLAIAHGLNDAVIVLLSYYLL